jgi:hypothetical protein
MPSMLPELDQGGFIALLFIGVIGLLLLIATFRYKSVDDVLKLWGGVGTIATAICTFYFTNAAADKRIAALQTTQDSLTAQLDAARENQKELTAALRKDSDGTSRRTLDGVPTGFKDHGPPYDVSPPPSAPSKNATPSVPTPQPADNGSLPQ